jgi:hypothetical protein
MVRVIDLSEKGLTAEQVHDSIRSPEGAIVRESGRVIARIEPADETDLEDEMWAHEPEQVARGAAARQRFEKGQSCAHEDLTQQLKRESGE